METIDQSAHLSWLEQQFESKFHCMVGPPRAYFELAEPLDSPRHLFRVAYQLFVLVAAPNSERSEEALVQAMWKDYFQPVVDELYKRDPERVPSDNVLFWRKKPAFETENGVVRLRMRLAIPGVRVPGEHVYP